MEWKDKKVDGNTWGRAWRPGSPARRRLLIFGMIAAMLAASAGITMAQSPDRDGATTPVTVTVTILEVMDAGQSWGDASGNHLRGQQVKQELSGDVAGTAHTVVNRDATAESEMIWITAQVESDSGPWSYRAIFTAGQNGDLELYGATLMGQSGNVDRTIVFDRIVEANEDSLTLAGELVERDRPTAPFNVQFDICITSLQTVSGAFSGTIADLNGDFEVNDRDVDSGAMDASFLVGGPVESGLVMGQGSLAGKHGTLEFRLAVDRYGPHGSGKAIFLGGSGAYADIQGTTKMLLTDKPNEDCPLGIGSSGSFYGSTSWSDG